MSITSKESIKEQNEKFPQRLREYLKDRLSKIINQTRNDNKKPIELRNITCKMLSNYRKDLKSLFERTELKNILVVFNEDLQYILLVRSMEEYLKQNENNQIK